MFGVDDILQNRSSNVAEGDDYYKILGCSETATVDQIITEYKIRALKMHPDKNVGDETALKEFQKLQEARNTLTDPEKKCKYDQWRNSGICMPYKQWLGLSSRSQMTMHWVNPRQGLMLEQDQQKMSSSQSPPPETDSKTKPENFKEPVITGVKLSKPWKTENTGGVYGRFRSYQI